MNLRSDLKILENPHKNLNECFNNSIYPLFYKETSEKLHLMID